MGVGCGVGVGCAGPLWAAVWVGSVLGPDAVCLMQPSTPCHARHEWYVAIDGMPILLFGK